jgi:hypothetical protein
MAVALHAGHIDYTAVMQRMIDDVLNSDVLGTYLVVSNTPQCVPRVTVLTAFIDTVQCSLRRWNCLT